jgi:hypothetical protein
MIVLRANNEQYKNLNGYRNDCSALEFVKDGNGEWIINLEVLKDPSFSEIHDQLNELEQIEYEPVLEEEE